MHRRIPQPAVDEGAAGAPAVAPALFWATPDTVVEAMLSQATPTAQPRAYVARHPHCAVLHARSMIRPYRHSIVRVFFACCMQASIVVPCRWQNERQRQCHDDGTLGGPHQPARRRRRVNTPVDVRFNGSHDATQRHRQPHRRPRSVVRPPQRTRARAMNTHEPVRRRRSHDVFCVCPCADPTEDGAANARRVVLAAHGPEHRRRVTLAHVNIHFIWPGHAWTPFVQRKTSHTRRKKGKKKVGDRWLATCRAALLMQRRQRRPPRRRTRPTCPSCSGAWQSPSSPRPRPWPRRPRSRRRGCAAP